MDQNSQDSQTLFPHETGHHRSARERQRKGPMWGCLKGLGCGLGGVLLLLLLVIGGGWWYLGTASFGDLVRLRIQSTLEDRLGRKVTIGSVAFDRMHLKKVVLNDIRIANAPGGINPYFATVRQVTITGGIESFWSRRVKVGRVDVVEPQIFFEVYAAGSNLVHNFPHWNSGPPSKYEIVHVDLNKLYVSAGSFTFLDQRQQITAVATGLASEMTLTRAQDLYEGVITSPKLTVRIQDYEPFDTDLRGGFRYTPGALALNSIALRGNGIEVFLSGRVAPVSEAAYDFRITSQIALQRIKEIFRVNQRLEGVLALDTRLRGKAGDFGLSGGWVSSRIDADAYELTNAKGRLSVNGDRTVVDVDSAKYGGGTIGAHYTLSKYAEPYPMTVELRYNGISIEHLFSDWTIENTGLDGAATGRLTYHWNKDKVLEGAGIGTAALSKTTAFSGAKYPMPIGGSIDYGLDNGVVTFRRAELDTPASHVSLAGTLRIEDVFTDLRMQIHSTDFSELDRVGYNFAHSAGKTKYTLLGLGGGGDITGTVKGRIKTPAVVAQIAGSGVKYNNVALGDAAIDLHYDGVRSILTFDRAVFSDGGGRLALTGTLGFPDRGPSPTFDIAVDATNYPVEKAVKAVDLKLAISGIGTGRMIVTGTPDKGKATFANLVVRRGDSEMRLNGDVAWLPGKGNVEFDLAVAAKSFPVADIVTFLDLGTMPVTGALTGTLQLHGPKSALEGAGEITVRNGSIYGEPVNVATANIAFTKGELKATNISVQAPAGTVTGEAQLNLTTNQFSYTINSSSIDLSKLKLLSTLQGLLGGSVVLTSSGGGTFENPELVVEATLNEATVRGLALPAGAPPPKIYIAIRNGRLVIRGSAADVLTIEGDGAVGQDLAVDGLVRITVSDVAKLLAMSPNLSSVPASGNLVVDLKLGGKLSSLEALQIDATVPELNLNVSDHQFTAPAPLHLSLRNGRVTFDSFELQRDGSQFRATGYADLTGAKKLAVDVSGSIEAALLQLFVPGLRADGQIALAMKVGGTLDAPVIGGTADLQSAQLRAPGFPQMIDNINGRLRFTGDGVTIEDISATVGGGSVGIGGTIALRGLKPQSVSLTISGKDVSLRYFEGLTIDGSFLVRLSGDMEHYAARGDVTITRAVFFKDIDFRQTLLNVVLSRRSVTPVVAAAWQNNVNLDLKVSAVNALAVRNNIAKVTGSAEDIEVRGTLANPIVDGTVTLDEGGTVTIQNVDYRVVRGTIDFMNPFRIDPFFDVTLEGRVSGGISEVESGPLIVTINVTGTLDRMTPTITSDPPASDVTLFSLVGLGGVTHGGAGGAPLAAGTVGQSLLYSSLFSALGSQFLPFVDSFSYDPGLLDTGSTAAGRKVIVEKRVSNAVRVIIAYNLDNARGTQGVIDWAVTPQWTLQLTHDGLKSQDRLDARFSRRYVAQWTWGRHGRTAQEIFPLASIAASVGQAAAPAPALPRTTAVAPLPAAGAVVSEVEFRPDRPLSTGVLSQYVVVKAGQPLSIRDVQSSIKALFATGNFRDIRVDASPAANGTRVTFALYLNYRIGQITYQGIAGRERTAATRGVRVHTGDTLSLDAVDDAATEVRDALRREGYLEATVDPETSFEADRNVADVTFTVTPGPRATVAAVNIDGDVTPFTTKELIDAMKEAPGQPFRLNEARTDADRMKNYLVRRDYRRADVRFLDDKYDAVTKQVTLHYRATAGPVVKVEVTGVRRSAVKGVLPFRKNQEYSEDAIDRAAEDITKLYQERGYFRATVDTESRLTDHTWTTTFNVKPGEHYKLTGVTFSGNLKEPDKALAKVVATAPAGILSRMVSTILRRATGVTQAQLGSDRDALESFYRLEGFSEVAIATPVVNTKADGTMTVDFPITEGPQTIVTAVSVEGTQQVPSRELPPLELAPGKPLNPQSERDDIIALQSFYANRGNSEVQITPRVEVSADKTSARVAYVIAEGPQIRIGEVIVRGNTYTDSTVILRKADIQKGEPFSYTALLEAQRNLYRLGTFSRVEVQQEQAGTSVSRRNVVISIEEGKELSASGSLGALYDRGQPGGATFSPRVSAAVAHRNLFGTGRYLGVEGVYAGQSDSQFYITYREPFIGKYNVPLQLTVFQSDDSTREDLRIKQRGMSLEASKITLSRTRWSLVYQYKRSQCVEGSPCDDVRNGLIVPTVTPSLLNVYISSIAPTFFWDKRDDIVDPHRGFFTSASVEYAFPILNARTSFLKEFVQGAWYLPVSTRSVLALAGRAGLLHPFGGSAIPLSERFVAGGQSSHRAYPQDLLGNACLNPQNLTDCREALYDDDPKGDHVHLVPLGGNGIFLVNAEYRFPIVGNVGGALFTDIGNVYGGAKIDFNDVRYGVGTGLRYLSPVGPLRFDMAWPLNRKPYERTYSYSISIGYPF